MRYLILVTIFLLQGCALSGYGNSNSSGVLEALPTTKEECCAKKSYNPLKKPKFAYELVK
jgi:hypothetical protein